MGTMDEGFSLLVLIFFDVDGNPMNWENSERACIFSFQPDGAYQPLRGYFGGLSLSEY